MTVGTQADLTSIGWLPYIGYAILEAVTTDTDTVLHPVAERSAQAILIKLARDGKLKRKDDRYLPSP